SVLRNIWSCGGPHSWATCIIPGPPARCAILARGRRIMSFPAERPRRLRRSERLRAMVRETHVTPANLVYPLFVAPGRGLRKEIGSLPGCFHMSVDEIAREAREVESLGIAGVILFGLPEGKDPEGTQGYAEDGVVQQAVRAIRNETKDLLVMTDV